MPVNAHPDYIKAEREYLQASSLNEKIEKLKKMISLAPSHKGAENLRAQLKTRLKKLIQKKSKEKKTKKSSKKTGIKKEGVQAVLIGKTNCGKSSLISILTNANPKISPIPVSTTKPIVATMHFESVNIQLIENPSINSEYFDKGLTNTADTLIIVITYLKELEEIKKALGETRAKIIVAVNKIDILNQNDLIKIQATLSTKKYNFCLISAKTQEGIINLKEKIFRSFDKIRVFTKEPKKDKSEKPIVLNPSSTVCDIAEKILSGFSKKIKQVKIWGPSSKFPGQIVGLNHTLKDMDVVEFKTK